MNKLRKKTFCTLFTILSIFFISILFIFNYQNYKREKIGIEQNLFRMNRNLNEKNTFTKPNNEDIFQKKKEENPRRFMDAMIYTILIDENDTILEIISHTEDGLVSTNVKEITKKIIRENKQNNTYIGNLYFRNYSYKYEIKNHIILIDHRDVKERLLSSLEITIVFFLLIEIVIAITSKTLANWITRPVETSFNKQKQFVADASHELKTPLSIIMACAETLEKNPKEQKWLKNIKSETERMSKLITNLLDLAKVEDEINKKLYEKINLSKLVEISILSFESLAYEKNIKLDYEVGDDIYFIGSSEQIRELLSILLDNAICHSSKKGKIMVRLIEEKHSIVLEVTNKGNPLPKGEEEKIFERFYRVDKSRNRNQNRYGLGLAIAKGIVTNHNGKITAFSYNNYTSFQVNLKK